MAPLIVCALAVLIAFVQLGSANFDLFIGRMGYHNPNRYHEDKDFFQIHSNTPTAKDVTWAPFFYGTTDLSHGRTGLRVIPGMEVIAQSKAPDHSIDTIEMHFTNKPGYHWTIYKSRTWLAPDLWTTYWEMIATNGKPDDGYCFAFPGWDAYWTYPDDFLDGGHPPFGALDKIYIQRLMRCITKIDGTDINKIARREMGIDKPLSGELLADMDGGNATSVPWEA